MHFVLQVLRTCVRWGKELACGVTIQDTTENYVKLGEMPRPTSTERAQCACRSPTLVRDEAVTRGQPEPVRLLANRDCLHGTTSAGKNLKKGKMTERDGDCSKVGGAINPERYGAHLTAERRSSLDLNDGREAFRWVRSVHDRDLEGLYLKASRLGGKEFIIWPNKHDAENEAN
ncbi:hypothetical protein EV421DRAFT_1739267 [Armillaria borealis]|uniref:Uncharacterized protein n=1 Tax=Armillaria borealis TaxID=47425 RepID=A0AA39MJZ0_9AGAR|nr:hypothetical protein EV421DRAFT_1739267 [Armillaria borealis]